MCRSTWDTATFGEERIPFICWWENLSGLQRFVKTEQKDDRFLQSNSTVVTTQRAGIAPLSIDYSAEWVYTGTRCSRWVLSPSYSAAGHNPRATSRTSLRLHRFFNLHLPGLVLRTGVSCIDLCVCVCVCVPEKCAYKWQRLCRCHRVYAACGSRTNPP